MFLTTESSHHLSSPWFFVFVCLFFKAKIKQELTLGPPPCIFRARTVATNTTTLGTRPEARHLMLKNFSIPISAPKPASVTAEKQAGNELVSENRSGCWQPICSITGQALTMASTPATPRSMQGTVSHGNQR